MSPSARRLMLGLVALVLVAVAAWVLYVRRAAGDLSGRESTQANASPEPAGSRTLTPDDWAERLNRAREGGDPRSRAEAFGRQLELWIAEDPEAALAYLRTLPPGSDYTQGLLAVLYAIGKTNPDRALALAAELAVNREQRVIYNRLFAEFARQDPRGAAQRISQVPAGTARENALRALADTWALADLPAALAWAQALTEAERSPALEATLIALAANDPLRALEMAQHSLTGAALERTWTAAFPYLVESDLSAAAALVVMLPESEARTHASLEVARRLAMEDSARALSWVEALPEGSARLQARHAVLAAWAAQDPGAAGRYVAAMPAGDERDAAVTTYARLLAMTDPQAAIRWTRESAEGEARSRAIAQVTSTWAQQDPASASAWAANLSVNEGRSEALQGALSYWLLQDVAGARDFVNGLTGDTQLQAAAYLAPRLVQLDPQAAMGWAQSLPTSEGRETALTAAYFRWLENSPKEARAWVEQAALPIDFKTRLLRAGAK